MNRFEHAVHTTRRDEGELSPEKFEELWLETQTTRSSATRSTSTATRTWWSYIPHFIGTPGYVYAYSYGFLFALSIFRKYELEGESMVEPYLDLLRAGGSQAARRSSREMVGLDLDRPGASGTRASTRSPSELDEAEALAADIGIADTSH